MRRFLEQKSDKYSWIKNQDHKFIDLNHWFWRMNDIFMANNRMLEYQIRNANMLLHRRATR